MLFVFSIHTYFQREREREREFYDPWWCFILKIRSALVKHLSNQSFVRPALLVLWVMNVNRYVDNNCVTCKLHLIPFMSDKTCGLLD